MSEYITNKNTIVDSSKMLNRKPYVIFLICALSLVAFILACQLSIANTSYDNRAVRSLAETMLGDSRIAISAKFYTQADLYFHRGVPHETQHAFESDPFQIIHNTVCPTDHDHLSGSTDIQEIMPWLDISIRANPQNLESYLVAAFWLSSEAELHEQALQVLARAQRNLPYSYEVQMAKGRIFLHTGKYNLARQTFSAALAFWNETASPTDKDDLLDKSQALLYRALLHEECGMKAEAIEDLQAMLIIAPGNALMHKRMINLKSNTPILPSAHDLLASLLNKQDKHKRECGHEDHDHDHNEHKAEK